MGKQDRLEPKVRGTKHDMNAPYDELVLRPKRNPGPAAGRNAMPELAIIQTAHAAKRRKRPFLFLRSFLLEISRESFKIDPSRILGELFDGWLLLSLMSLLLYGFRPGV